MPQMNKRASQNSKREFGFSASFRHLTAIPASKLRHSCLAEASSRTQRGLSSCYRSYRRQCPRLPADTESGKKNSLHVIGKTMPVNGICLRAYFLVYPLAEADLAPLAIHVAPKGIVLHATARINDSAFVAGERSISQPPHLFSTPHWPHDYLACGGLSYAAWWRNTFSNPAGPRGVNVRRKPTGFAALFLPRRNGRVARNETLIICVA